MESMRKSRNWVHILLGANLVAETVDYRFDCRNKVHMLLIANLVEETLDYGIGCLCQEIVLTLEISELGQESQHAIFNQNERSQIFLIIQNQFRNA